jgi:hypothetical protein
MTRKHAKCPDTSLLDLLEIVFDRIKSLPQRIIFQVKQLEAGIKIPNELGYSERSIKVSKGDTGRSLRR